MLLHGLLLLSFCASEVPASGGSPSVAPAPLKIQVIYDQTAAPGSPEETASIANIAYPVAKGPANQGYPVEPLPVFVSARGGNTNDLTIGDLSIDQMSTAAIQVGFVGVRFNYPIVGQGDDYNKAADGVALLIQHLRANAADYNIDPARVFLMGRSFGTVVGHAVALKENHQDLSSSNSDEHQDSRPTYWVPRFGPSDLTCFPQDTSSWASIFTTFFFPGQTFAEATQEQRLLESPFWWLLRPDLHAREATPPMCVVYIAEHSDVCGQNTDPHSGLFGDILLDAMDSYADQSGDRSFLQRSTSISTSDFPDPTPVILGWATSRLADDFEGLYLLPPTGEVALGQSVLLQVAGAVPGSTVTFFSGATAGTFPMPGCPDLLGQITDFVQLGASVASGAGVASLSFTPAPGVVGQTALFHAVGFDNCEASNVSVHQYY